MREVNFKQLMINKKENLSVGQKRCYQLFHNEIIFYIQNLYHLFFIYFCNHIFIYFIFFFQGDLGAIDAKYDVAISTACGPLDNIVTDTINTAQECVEFIKRENLGYATFIALDKVIQPEYLTYFYKTLQKR